MKIKYGGVSNVGRTFITTLEEEISAVQSLWEICSDEDLATSLGSIVERLISGEKKNGTLLEYGYYDNDDAHFALAAAIAAQTRMSKLGAYESSREQKYQTLNLLADADGILEDPKKKGLASALSAGIFTGAAGAALGIMLAAPLGGLSLAVPLFSLMFGSVGAGVGKIAGETGARSGNITRMDSQRFKKIVAAASKDKRLVSIARRIQGELVKDEPQDKKLKELKAEFKRAFQEMIVVEDLNEGYADAVVGYQVGNALATPERLSAEEDALSPENLVVDAMKYGRYTLAEKIKMGIGLAAGLFTGIGGAVILLTTFGGAAALATSLPALMGLGIAALPRAGAYDKMIGRRAGKIESETFGFLMRIAKSDKRTKKVLSDIERELTKRSPNKSELKRLKSEFNEAFREARQRFSDSVEKSK